MQGDDDFLQTDLMDRCAGRGVRTKLKALSLIKDVNSMITFTNGSVFLGAMLQGHEKNDAHRCLLKEIPNLSAFLRLVRTRRVSEEPEITFKESLCGTFTYLICSHHLATLSSGDWVDDVLRRNRCRRQIDA